MSATSSTSSTKLHPAAPDVNRPILRVENLGKTYRTPDHELTVLDSVCFAIAPGETTAIVGPSGSGKTTLLGLCAGLDDPTTGTVDINGTPLTSIDEDGRAALRNEMIGFVFQNFQLIPTLTALENVLVPLELRGQSGRAKHARVLLEKVGLGDRTGHYPQQLSGGEQQRVALARAFVHQPRLLFADEPTGNLDAATSGPIEDMLFRLNRDHGTALVMVTHDPALAARTGRVITMSGGRVTTDQPAPRP